jgi:hypothetical protein
LIWIKSHKMCCEINELSEIIICARRLGQLQFCADQFTT